MNNTNKTCQYLIMEDMKRVLKLPKKQSEIVSEDDILHLFFALVKLVKKNAMYEATKNVEKQIMCLNEKIRVLENQLLEKENKNEVF